MEHERALFNVAYRYVWNREDARDVVHDAFVRMWNKRDRIDWERAAGLAYRTVLGLAANRRRAHAVRRAFASLVRTEPSAPSSETSLAEARTDAAVRRAIDELPEKLRSVLVMCAFTELDHAQIAAALGVPVGTIGSRRHEAIARIRAKLEGDHG